MTNSQVITRAVKYILDPKFGSALRSVLRIAAVVGMRYGLHLDPDQIMIYFASFEALLQALVLSPVGNAPVEVNVAAINDKIAKDQVDALANVVDAQVKVAEALAKMPPPPVQVVSSSAGPAVPVLPKPIAVAVPIE